MSNPTDDQINDRMDRDWCDLLDEYTQDKKGMDEFIDWLWDTKQDDVRAGLLDKFANSEDGKRFRSWAWDVTADRMTNREPDNE